MKNSRTTPPPLVVVVLGSSTVVLHTRRCWDDGDIYWFYWCDHWFLQLKFLEGSTPNHFFPSRNNIHIYSLTLINIKTISLSLLSLALHGRGGAGSQGRIYSTRLQYIYGAFYIISILQDQARSCGKFEPSLQPATKYSY